MISTVPLGKWRALTEWVNAKEKQKAAYGKAQGDFLYLMGLSDNSGNQQETEGCLQVLQAVCRFADSVQLSVYIEARPQQRQWLRIHGFRDLFGYKVRRSNKAPQIFMMEKPPSAVLQKVGVRGR